MENEVEKYITTINSKLQTEMLFDANKMAEVAV